MKRPFTDKRLLGPFIFSQGSSSNYNTIAHDLHQWGATRISAKQLFEDLNSLDFNTPMPGDQPIRSSVEFNDSNKVIRATLRYGVLDENLYATHPSNKRKHIDRLKEIVDDTDYPDTLILVNYGDDHRLPRPHMLVNWAPSIADNREYVNDTTSTPIEWSEFFNFIKDVGDGIKKEFKDEWV